MRFPYMVLQLLVIVIMILVSSCAGQTVEKDFEDFDSNNFNNSTNINNKWFPLKAGTQFVYEGETFEEGESIPHKIVITVTDLTKVIGGVRSMVTWDRDYSKDELTEAELAFFAQDNDGNVWRMGEYPEEYEGGQFTIAPTWIHGLEDARAGIAMQAGPQLETPSYSQGWGPAVDWTDRGQVDQMGIESCVPVTCYQDVLVIAETSKSEQGAFQLKYFAPNVGNVRTDWKGTDQTQETLELTEIIQLSPEELAQVREEALKLEKHAYEVSDMYKQTSPVEYPEGTPAIQVENAEAPQASVPEGSASEVIVYASDLLDSALSELDFYDEEASPGKKLISLPNNGDELDPPPENDPHVTFNVQVQSGVPYRCWIHMKVGTPKGRSQANTIWVQFSDAVDKADKEVFKPGSSSYLTAQGPAQEGWAWVGCDLTDSTASDSLVYFQTSGEVTVRLQAGAEGVGFDQFILSPAEFLEEPPSEAVVEK
ncbi:MAG: hypothetical protein HW374_1606 [Bacteroidetes bacterium]|nr:hypothetical protein [Bacteroidota bacterium]